MRDHRRIEKADESWWWTIDKMYEEMKRDRQTGDLEKSMNRRIRLTLVALPTWIVVMAFSAGWLYFHIERPPVSISQPTLSHEPRDPLLKGPPQFILLALIVALSAYLRQVRSTAVEQHDKIANGGVWNYPLDSPYLVFTKRKLKLLDGVANNLTVASPFFIVLFVVITGRAGIDALDRFRHPGGFEFTQILCIIDFIIVIWVFLAFLGLTVSHFITRIRDDRIRAVARDFEDEIRHQQAQQNALELPQVQASSKPTTPAEAVTRKHQQSTGGVESHPQTGFAALLALGLVLLAFADSERK